MAHVQAKLKNVAGQPSWRLASKSIEAFVTRTAGMLAPATFGRGKKSFQPFQVAPWHAEKWDPALPNLLKVLRGDFFCLPFGGNESKYQNEKHPPHGETANADWAFEGLDENASGSTLRLSFKTRIRKGRVRKELSVRPGQNVIYSRHVVSGMRGPMNFGHHATLRFPSSGGLISTSAFAHGQVFPGVFEAPENKGYPALKAGAMFTNIRKVPSAFGGTVDCSRYPARRGFEDLFLLASPKSSKFGWVTAVFPKERKVWFALKDPRVLRSLLFWHSNGGRYYAPWNGRHVDVLGLEDITGYFHYGIKESVSPNPLSKKGLHTSVKMNPKKPLVVNYIMGVADVPAGFGRVKTLMPAKDRQSILLTDEKGRRTTASVDVDFLYQVPK